MEGRATIVLDIGKTLSKLSLWAPDGTLIERQSRPNERIRTSAYLALDIVGIEAWLAKTLRRYAGLADVGAIIPVGHGAAAAIVRDGSLLCPPLDYEDVMPAGLAERYSNERDPFTHTGSPRLPHGLNLGAQIYRLETLGSAIEHDATILPWPQYWSWLLSGVAACEVTSLGCHTDLWYPFAGIPSRLAERRGWSKQFAPLRRAGEILGTLKRSWAVRTGLPADTQIYCGVHDSNAALLAARGFAELAGKEATVMSTGTWFVAMRSPQERASAGANDLDEARDCLVNVDVSGMPTPSARFMGGREIEALLGPEAAISHETDAQAALGDIIDDDIMALPCFAPGFGPYPRASGRWTTSPRDNAKRRTVAALYAALVADASLELIGARERLLVEGRFAQDRMFVGIVATLRPDIRVYAGQAHNDVSYGALRLQHPDLLPAARLEQVQPFDLDLRDYRDRWRHEAARGTAPA